ncbi:glycosyltransferase family 2 protein [Cytophaga hutchinsonii]|uniref:B-glycosyltransferase, glycosyltransferase family 2 protein n=1 Tax=Cytophaga hutchinsonii (strain ATCC 33406 / DSM 1761 / CIP 103989 / NBRC 15051 / NCIMB 9469 / D465) TaxID=269798 RepID=A0A6N4SPH6_CYTH3|nr:glycosyltransferase [Cytophaga hutchinsonii]ABG58165.1 b-glycosyltransferase, glycosyltransferase family 2 protein [Cytophaga hutchinsonii ATCC 33406]SFY02770.1 Glycosyltransferase, GT2 family [Cytophaga hutchinsonii ATCC 33406]
MKLSVIIPTCNRSNLLIHCLSALYVNVLSINNRFECEVIVTDDSSDEETKTLIQQQYTWVKWVKGPRKGPAANRNNGVKNADGDWYLFIDDDCLPDTEILTEYYNAISANPEMRAFEGRIYVDGPKKSFLHESPINETGGFFWSCNICIQKDLFYQLKGFDEQFPFAAMEDVDLFRRLRQITDKHAFLFNASVVHPWRLNRNLIKTTLKRHASQEYYIQKHPEEAKRLNAMRHFRYFVKNNLYLVTHAWKYRFSGFGTLLYCNFLQLYFCFKTLLKSRPDKAS